MSPIDDELRAALQGRARAVSPSPDPLVGIERRARRIRRNRVAASVAGSALAVAAIATAVPLLSTTPTSQPAPQASRPVETLQPSPSGREPSALDPTDPWPYRGDASLLDSGFPEVLDSEMAARRGVPDSAIEVTPLFGQVYEPSGRAELVVLVEEEGFFSWVVAMATESGPEIVWENGIGTPTVELAAALAGDEVARLLVVSAPGTSAEYGPDDASEFEAMAELADGVHTLGMDGDPARDVYRVLDAAGEEVFRSGAPDLATAPPDGEASAEPANLLDWPQRGAALDPELEARVTELFQAAVEGLDGEPTDAGVAYRPLFTGDTDGGVRYTIGQAWVVGREAHTVSLVQGGEQGEQFRLGPLTDPDARVVGEVLCCQPGSTVDTLVVVPVPGTGQVLYDEDDEGDFRPVGEGQDFLDGVVLVDRDVMAQADRLQLLDGNGDPDRPLFQGPVSNLLCGVRECG